jgi:flagellar basal body rod protein FlgC
MQIQDVHATGDITPNYVDTSVINQSALLILNVTGSDNFDNISIVLPSSYKIVNVTEVSNKTNIIYNNTLGAVYFNVTFGGYTLNISNFTQGFNATDSFLKINFTINTSSTAVSSTRIRVNMTGSNLTNVNATETGTNSLNITTQQMINITTVTVTKSTAIVNGTDYWEFNITVNITANTSGILQFRMNNWNSTTQGYGLLNLTNETGAFVENVTYRAMLRNQSAQTGSQQLNVTTDYGNLTRGLSLDYTGITKTLILKMTIPTGMPYTSDWWSTYYILFRSST